MIHLQQLEFEINSLIDKHSQSEDFITSVMCPYFQVFIRNLTMAFWICWSCQLDFMQAWSTLQEIKAGWTFQGVPLALSFFFIFFYCHNVIFHIHFSLDTFHGPKTLMLVLFWVGEHLFAFRYWFAQCRGRLIPLVCKDMFRLTATGSGSVQGGFLLLPLLFSWFVKKICVPASLGLVQLCCLWLQIGGSFGLGEWDSIKGHPGSSREEEHHSYKLCDWAGIRKLWRIGPKIDSKMIVPRVGVVENICLGSLSVVLLTVFWLGAGHYLGSKQ